MLVQASELKEAVEIVETEMKKTMIDYAFASVTETAIMDVFLHGRKGIEGRRMNIATHIQNLRESLPPQVKVVASKFHPTEQIREAYDAGQRLFGESRVQELVGKQQELPGDIEWHFIGSLQRNKVKQIAPFVSLIHSLDSERLMREIEKQGAACGRVIHCLLQVHIAEEETKSGFSPDECRRFLEEGSWKKCPHLQIAGMMGMATYTDEREQVHREFRS